MDMDMDMDINPNSNMNVPDFATIMNVNMNMNLRMTTIDDPNFDSGILGVMVFPIVSNRLKHNTKRVPFQAGESPPMLMTEYKIINTIS